MREATRDPSDHRLEDRLPASGVYAGVSGHLLIFRCPRNTMIIGGRTVVDQSCVRTWPVRDAVHSEALLIGGRSGVGKTTVGAEISAQLQIAGIAHCLIEGDNLDQAFPAPPDDPSRTKLTEANLAALWRNYASRGYRRLIYTNTVSVLEPDLIARAMGGAPRIVSVLLTAQDATARHRLGAREIGSQLDAHVRRGADMAVRLETAASPDVVRMPTDGRSVEEIAREIITATHWLIHP